MTPIPQRIRLSRQRGFRLQEVSAALNGLPAVKVDRSTRWGNPFIVGQPHPFGGGFLVVSVRHAVQLYEAQAWQNTTLLDAARRELAGKNLACWCKMLDPYDRYECHVIPLLAVANGTLAMVPGWQFDAPHPTHEKEESHAV